MREQAGGIGNVKGSDVLVEMAMGYARSAMSDLNMLSVTGGKERNAAEWRQLLFHARFELRRIVAVPGESACIIEAAPMALT
jgi:hypothetical protein